MNKSKFNISFFEKFLSIWVILCMIIGIFISKFIPFIPTFLSQFEYAQISIPMVILIWVMIYPMMMKINFSSIKNVGKNPRGLYLTWVVNWMIKPFTMFAIGWVFFYIIFKKFLPEELAQNYLTGLILLGAAPCTAMVFVWSHLTDGDPAYTVVQVATNDLIILFAFTPIVALLLGVHGVFIPWNTLILSVILFVLIPLISGVVTRNIVIKLKGVEYFEKFFLVQANKYTIIALLLTLIVIFSFQGSIMLNNLFHIVLVAIPLLVQTFLIFFTAYWASKFLRLPRNIAAPAAIIGASNFFELSMAVAIALFGINSPVVLATIVGVLIEVPVMLILVKIMNNNKYTVGLNSIRHAN